MTAEIKNTNRGILPLVLFLFIFVVGLVVYILIYKSGVNISSNGSKNRTEYRTENGETSKNDYAPLKESKNTPKELNNSVVNELDNIMKDIDNSSTENVNDLSL